MRHDRTRGASLRIAYVCTDPGIPVFGNKGASIHVQEVVRALLRRGHRVELFTCRVGGSPPGGLESVPVHRFSRPSAREAAVREGETRALDKELLRRLRRSGPFDLVYQRYSLWSDGGMRFAREAGTRGILEVNAPLLEEQALHRTLVDREGADAMTRSAFRSAHLLVAVSEPVADWVGRIAAGVEDRVRVVPNGVDVSRFRAGKRADGARPAAPFTIGFVGTLKPWHGLPVLMQAFARVAGSGVPCRLLLVGDGPERTRIEEEASRRGLADQVRFTGAVPHERIPALLQELDVAVAPYPEPGPTGFYFSPLKVLEYLAARVPVVASRLGSIEKVITHGIHGLLTTPGDPASLAAALERLRADPLLRRRLAENGHRQVTRRHTWDQVVERILTLSGVGPGSEPEPVLAAPGVGVHA